MLLLICCALILTAVLCFTNVRKNLMLASLTANRVDTVTVFFGSQSATLSQADVEQLVPLIQTISLQGRSVRLTVAEEYPCYSVRLKSGKIFTLTCYNNYYIVDGRSYPVTPYRQSNYDAIQRLYEDHCGNREYFPRNESGRD